MVAGIEQKWGPPSFSKVERAAVPREEIVDGGVGLQQCLETAVVNCFQLGLSFWRVDLWVLGDNTILLF